MKHLIFALLFLLTAQTSLATIDDLKITSRGNGGKVSIEPKNNSGSKIIVIEADGQNATVTIPSSVTLKVDNVTNVAGTEAPTGIIPAGTIVSFVGSSAPNGWFIADGSCKTTATYPVLSNLMTTSGIWNQSGCAVGEFKLPDLRNRFLRSIGTNGDGHGGDALTVVGEYQGDTTAKNGLGATSGNQSASHSHSVTGGATTTGGNANTVQDVGSGVDGYATSSATAFQLYHSESHTHSVPNHTHSVGNQSASHNHTITLSSTDTETAPKSYGVNYIIKY